MTRGYSCAGVWRHEGSRTRHRCWRNYYYGLEEERMKLTMLGTGNALVTECYNTCFIMDDDHKLFMVDGGGGNTILHQIKHAGYDWMDIRHIFVTHKHVDHLMGIIWIVRMICQFMDHGKFVDSR